MMLVGSKVLKLNKIFIPILLLLFACGSEPSKIELVTPFEASDSLSTSEYQEGIEWWKSLAQLSSFVNVIEYGITDVGLPLHLVIIKDGSVLDLKEVSKSNKSIWLINNAIHPGEPDGVDASMLFARELLNSDDVDQKLKDVIIVIIPFYNIGGALNRNKHSRSNQNGPVSYGFRGNARNLDLNRDFIKADSRNAQSFNALIDILDPDLYLETHVSNGANYQYTLTYLLSHPDKMMSPLSKFTREKLEPFVIDGMKNKNDEAIAYVNVHNTSPDSGYAAFYDSPRYSSGYLNLFNTLGVMSETHMLKDFSKRVVSTLNFMHVLMDACVQYSHDIKGIRKESFEILSKLDSLNLEWETDYSAHRDISFKGYEAYYEMSKVTHLPQLYYNDKVPWQRNIKYYDRLKSTKKVVIPSAYLVPIAWEKVIDQLKKNGAQMRALEKDSSVYVSRCRIVKYETSDKPYEGHYFHYNTELEWDKTDVNVRKGEYFVVKTDQRSRRYIVEVLEADAPDSYFNWNYFDEILQQKEWFSSYIFDEEAEGMLKDSRIAQKFDSIVSSNPFISTNVNAQLYYLYKMSPHYEKDRHMIYPVYRIE